MKYFNRTAALKALESIDAGEIPWGQDDWSYCFAAHVVRTDGWSVSPGLNNHAVRPDGRRLHISDAAQLVLFGENVPFAEEPVVYSKRYWHEDATRTELGWLVDRYTKLAEVVE